MNTTFEYIASTKNPKVQHVKRLKDKSYRRSAGEFAVEGENFIKDIPPNKCVTAIFVEKSKAQQFDYILTKYPLCKKYIVDGKVMSAMSDTVTPCGILATLKIEVCGDSSVEGNVALLDRVSDPGNMGTIIRTCAALGVESIIAVDCADCFSPKVIRASMGGIFYVNVLEKTVDEALELLANHRIYALDMNGENLYSVKTVVEPFAIAVGNESSGLSDKVRAAGRLVSLPMSGKIESLNAAVSMSIALYEILCGKVND